MLLFLLILASSYQQHPPQCEAALLSRSFFGIKLISLVVSSGHLMVTILIIHYNPIGIYLPFSDGLFFNNLMSSHLKVALNTNWQSNWDFTVLSASIFSQQKAKYDLLGISEFSICPKEIGHRGEEERALYIKKLYRKTKTSYMR